LHFWGVRDRSIFKEPSLKTRSNKKTSKMSSARGGGGDPHDELEQVQMKTSQVVDQSLESTRRMLNMCEESQDAGAKTLTMLNAQGEQLDRVEEGMDQINNDMREAEKNLTGMEKCCGLCVLPCNRTQGFKEDAETWKSSEDGRVINNQPQRIIDDRDRNGAATTSSSQGGGYIQRITNDAREDEMEDNMGQVSTMIGNLKNMAIDMGTEIEGQNSQIDRINNKAQSNEARISMANQRAAKLVKS